MSKVAPLSEIVRGAVRSGDTVFVGGFGQAVPFAIGFEIARQRIGDLVLCRTGADILVDMLIAAGCARRVVIGWIGNPGLGLAHAFNRAVAAGRLEFEETSNFGLLLRLLAARLGVPYLPTRSLLGGDMPQHLPTLKQVKCPFTGETLAAVSALTPDVAILHAQRSDEHGNIQAWGILGDTVEGVLASKCVIATVEEIVSSKEIARQPDRTIVPGHRVDAVALVPFGAYPSYCQDYYGRDDDFYRRYDAIARKEESLTAWLAENVHALPDWTKYLAHVGPARLEDMIDAAGPDARAHQVMRS